MRHTPFYHTSRVNAVHHRHSEIEDAQEIQQRSIYMKVIVILNFSQVEFAF